MALSLVGALRVTSKGSSAKIGSLWNYIAIQYPVSAKTVFSLQSLLCHNDNDHDLWPHRVEIIPSCSRNFCLDLLNAYE
jgi:hypothetical protein